MLRTMSGKTPSAKTEAVEEPAAEATEEPAPAKRKFGKKQLIMAAAPVSLIGVVAGLWFTGILPGLLGMQHSQPGPEASRPAVPVFIDLPDMIANLASPANKASYIKLQVRLEIAQQADADKVKQEMPRLQDMFQTYLREMRPEELRGSAGIYRLREELLGRANVVLAPVRVNDVLFTQLLIQ
jgi:flagellar FliL protein